MRIVISWFLYSREGVVRKVFRWKRGRFPNTRVYPGETFALMLQLHPFPLKDRFGNAAPPKVEEVRSFEVLRVVTAEQLELPVQALAGSDLPDLASMEAWDDYLEARIAEQTLLRPPKN